jgi:hypothetical protein
MSRSIGVALVIWVSLAIVGCKDLGNLSEEDLRPAASTFQLQDTQGRVKASFAPTDTVVFVYALRNPRTTQREFYIGHGGPWAQFLMRHDTSTVKDSYSGAVFPAVALRGTLASGETIDTRWTLDLGSSSLASGSYTAVVIPHVLLDGSEVPPNLALVFTIR